MARSFYSHIRDAWKDPDNGKLAELQWQRQQEWRQQGSIERIDRPTRLDRARSLGYKAKQGVVVEPRRAVDPFDAALLAPLLLSLPLQFG